MSIPTYPGGAERTVPPRRSGLSSLQFCLNSIEKCLALISFIAIFVPLVKTSIAVSVLLLSLLFEGICLLTSETRRAPRGSLLDVSVLLLTSSFALSFLHSVYRPGSVLYTGICLRAMLLFFVIRFASDKGLQTQTRAASVFAVIVGCLAIVNFATRFSVWRSYGFTDIIPFKRNIALFTSQLAPGMISPIFLALLGIALASSLEKNSKSLWPTAGATLMVLAIYLTFSRAMYLSFVVLLIGVTVFAANGKRRMSKGRVLRSTGIFVLGMSCLWLANILWPGIETLAFWTNSSQKRSAEGRVEAARISFQVFKQHPFLGGGPGTFPLFVNSREGMQPDTPFYGQTFNVFLQTAAEEGAFGLFGLSVLAVAILRAGIICLRKHSTACYQFREVKILLACAASILLCNLSESSLMTSPVVTMLTFVLSGLLAHKETVASTCNCLAKV